MLGEMISVVLCTRGVILRSYAVQTQNFYISGGRRTLFNNISLHFLD